MKKRSDIIYTGIIVMPGLVLGHVIVVIDDNRVDRHKSSVSGHSDVVFIQYKIHIH